LQQIIEQKLGNTLIGTIADEDAINTQRKKGVKVGDAFDMEVGGRLDVSAGKPVRIKGTVNTVSGGVSHGPGKAAGSQLWVSVKFGDGNEVIISPYLCQIIQPRSFLDLGIDPDKFKAFAIRSRVHFHRGFTDSGYCKTFILVEPGPAVCGHRSPGGAQLPAHARQEALSLRQRDLSGQGSGQAERLPGKRWNGGLEGHGFSRQIRF
jgi:microcystin degradation protein MlrC